MKLKNIKLEKKNNIAIVTFNRPQKNECHNARDAKGDVART
jgi:enoyl-CoA hydratase/carnithine racemase